MRITAAAVQFTHRASDKPYNLALIDRYVADAATAGAQLAAFPELCVTGYWHIVTMDRDGIAALAEPIPDGPTTRHLLALAKRHRVVIGAGLIESHGDRFHNSYVVVEPDGRFAVHRKLHAFENTHITPGDRFTVWDSSLGCRLGILICYDNNIIENPRITALLGADILIAPHQTGGTASKSPHAMGLIDVGLWRDRERHPERIEAEFRGDKGRGWLMRWLPARAHDNGMFVVFSNGVGEDAGEVRTGNAMLIDCYGRIINETWAARDEVVVGELDLSLLERSTGRRWMRGRRPELYEPLLRRTGNELHPIEARFSDAPVRRAPV
jgi:predicted amidohydrolase